MCIRDRHVRHAAVGKGQAELLYQIAAQVERHGGANGAVDAGAVGGGEDLFGGQVGDVGDAIERRGGAAQPAVVERQADGQIGAGAGEVEGVVLALVEQGRARRQFGGVGLPGGQRVGRVEADGAEDGVP